MVEFKKASEKDIPLLQQLAEKSWNSAYANILSKEQIEYMLSEMYSHTEISNHFRNPNYHYYVIVNDDLNAGFIGFENHYEKDTTKLHRIYLLEEFKGKGLGKKAINFLKDKVAETSDKRIVLNVNKDNSAKKVYESQGFKVYHDEVFDIGNGYVMDDYLMEFSFQASLETE
ncbi:GNAT family N-acetyltransferase [Kaistella flava (ex Peng et al. 2021)]|uniref:GNAT family N-acetyltransferase n=1 Tax=Kaistella flava (ex Peng et al. 2021) TaxID=2038776 RepID=A0A7M2YC57_9FLAO|nr:GNAT family N-acetyltransferase [Kaistella flava (ex Peng et al. 2021)]QOW11857.1 GNAT family N-acetyltransferase [Kaistella flava (ex Peng et al. 2021)]